MYAWCLSSIIMFMISGFFFSRVFKLSIAEMFSPVWSSLVAVAIMVVVLVLVRIGLYRLKWSSISVFATVVSLGALIHLLAIVLLKSAFGFRLHYIHEEDVLVRRKNGWARFGLGELFVVRDAGNTVDTVGLGSIQYAVEHLGVPLVVVLGHRRCGSVQAAVASGPGERDLSRQYRSDGLTDHPRRLAGAEPRGRPGPERRRRKRPAHRDEIAHSARAGPAGGAAGRQTQNCRRPVRPGGWKGRLVHGELTSVAAPLAAVEQRALL